MKRALQIITLLGLAAVANTALARLNVFACEPEWGALARELGGEQVKVYTATTAAQDPHHIQARPSLIARARRADLLVCNGAGLEAGWLPLLLRRAGNGAIQPGQPGHFLAADQVELLGRPQVVDRALGDIHAEGNPHIATDPHNILRVADALAPVMAALDADHREHYLHLHADFSRRWQRAVLEWEARAAPLEGRPVAVQHDSWVYLNAWLGLRQVATLEPVAGVSPSAAHLASLLGRLRQDGAVMVIRAAYQDPRPAAWMAEHLRVPEVVLPYTVGARGVDDLFRLYDVTVERLMEALP